MVACYSQDEPEQLLGPRAEPGDLVAGRADAHDGQGLSAERRRTPGSESVAPRAQGGALLLYADGELLVSMHRLCLEKPSTRGPPLPRSR